MTKSLTYSDAGVDIDKANHFVNTIKGIARQTPRSGVMGEIGGFGALFTLNTANIESPVLVSSTDGVGTKLKIAFMMNKHNTVGIDVVAMCVNDIATLGAKPLFFLDYLAVGKLDTGIATDIITGIADGCREASCALIGGETAEMPGFYNDNEYDMAGFVVGLVDDSKIIDGSEIRVGHKLICIPSNGLHSNGYSLVRKICFDTLKLKIDDYVPELDRTIGEELLRPTRIYTDLIMKLTRDLPIHGLAHITGGGLVDNISRVIPDACNIVINRNSWDVPPIFSFLQKAGNLSEMEMMRTFNNGVGMVAIVPDKAASDVLTRLRGMNEKPAVIGEIVERKTTTGMRVEWV